MSLLVICEILGLFVNTFTADEKYFLCNSENLPEPIQIQLSKKEKTFPQFFVNFWNLHQILNILKQKMTFMAYVFLKLQTAKDFVRPMSKNYSLRTPFDSKHVKESQTLVRSAWGNFYHIFLLLWGKLNWKRSLLVMCEILEHFVNTLTAEY